jgi:tRNA pseudouridine55 synthase
MARRKKGDKIDGILLLNKPKGMTSNNVLQQVKSLYNAQKAGHTGALDPLATGMLPICFGEATKFSQFLLDSDKTYRVIGKLGERTDTSDSTGEVIDSRPVDVSDEQLNNALKHFRGKSMQTPSMFSALKHKGQPLYKYARKGIHIERPERPIFVERLDLLRFEKTGTGTEVELFIHCTKGTYIRNIIEDLGERLGCGAHVIELHRESVAHYSTQSIFTLSDLENTKKNERCNYLLPIDSGILHLERITLDWNSVHFFLQGQAVHCSDSQIKRDNAENKQTLRIYNEDELFLGIAQMNAHDQLSPQRLVVHSK